MHAAFLPTFLTSVASSVTPEAVELCGNNTDCLFDFQVTGSKEIAQETLDFTTKLEEAEDAAVPGRLEMLSNRIHCILSRAFFIYV